MTPETPSGEPRLDAPYDLNWDDEVEGESRFRDHSAFLNSYGAEDEGLYDDYPIPKENGIGP